MASQIDTFKTVTANVTTQNSVVYTTPAGITAIILMAQCTNITPNNHTVTFSHISSLGNKTELIKDYHVLKNDAVGLLTGKLIVEVNPKYFRPSEVEYLLGNPSAAMKKLGWKPSVKFKELVDIMVTHKLREYDNV